MSARSHFSEAFSYTPFIKQHSFHIIAFQIGLELRTSHPPASVSQVAGTKVPCLPA